MIPFCQTRSAISHNLLAPSTFLKALFSLATAFFVAVSPGAAGLASILFALSAGGTAHAITGCTCGCTGDCNASSSCSCTGESSTPIPTGNLVNQTANLSPNSYNITAFLNSAYVFNGVQNPDLTLIRGQTYTFNINASGHPFAIKSVQGPTSDDLWNEGVTNNGTDFGTVTFVVPQDAPANLFYNCEIHDSMTGNLFIVDPDTFNVTNDGANAYIINSQSNPDLTLVRGRTYTFNVNASGHPFAIKSVQGPGTGNLFSEGVTNNEADTGVVTFVVPADAPDTLYYDCEAHGAMTGTLHIISIGSGDGSLLAPTQILSSAPYLPGANVTLTVVITNSSTHAQPDNSGDEFTEVLPDTLTIVSVDADSGTPTKTDPTAGNGGTASWNGTIAGNGTVTITIVAKISSSSAGQVINTQGTVNYDSDNDGTNETSALTDDPGTAAANDANAIHVASVVLSASQTVSGVFVPNGPITYTVVITNTGAGAQTNNTGDEFTEAFPSDIVVGTVSSTSGTAVAAGNTVTWNGALAAAGTVTITVHANVGNDPSIGDPISSQGTLSYDFDLDGTNEATAQTYAPPLGNSPQPTVFTVNNPEDRAFVAGTKAGDFNVLTNDYSRGVTLTVTAVTQGQHGTVTFSPTGIIHYVPNGKLTENGDHFTYTVSDGNGGSYTADVDVLDFSGIAGNYNGSVEPSNGTDPATSNLGLIHVTVSTKGAITGTLTVAGTKFSLKGVLDSLGVARFGKALTTDLTIKRKAPLPALDVAFQLFPNDEAIEGSVSVNSTALADLFGARVVFNAKTNPVPAEILGKYTVLFESIGAPNHSLNANQYPQGAGFGRLSLAPSGTATMTGKLADGTAFSYSNAISRFKELPIYVPLYKSGGALFSSIEFNGGDASSDVDTTDTLWFRPANPKAKTYVNGWPDGIELDCLGSHFAVQKGVAILPGLDQNGDIEFSLGAGNLTTDPTNLNAMVSPKNKVTFVSPPADLKPKVTISTSGLFSGSFVHPVSHKSTPIQGVIYQKEGFAEGYFIGPTESGDVSFGAP